MMTHPPRDNSHTRRRPSRSRLRSHSRAYGVIPSSHTITHLRHQPLLDHGYEGGAVPILVEHPAMCGRDGRVAHRPPLERGSGRGTAPCEAAGHRRRCDDSDAAAAIRGRSTTYGLVEQRRQRTAHTSPRFPAIPGSFPHARG